MALLLSACATNPVSGKPELVMMSEDEELSLGRKWHPRLVEQYGGKYPDPRLQAYINRIGERLVDSSHRKDLVYHFTLLDSPVINAFAIPGGYVYVTRGILPYLNSEDELAALLGHELGHITARHGVRQHAKQTVASVLLNVLASQTRTAYADDALGLVSQMVILGHGREHELEADKLGADYIEGAGYERRAILDLLESLKQQEEWEKKLAEEQDRSPNVYHGVFSTHPSSDKRLQEIVLGDDDGQATGSPRRQEYLEKIDGLIFGPSKNQGVARGDSFHHRNLGVSIDFPPDWVIKNKPGSVVAHNYGNTVVLRMTATDQNRRQSPKEYLESVFTKDKLERGMPATGKVPGYVARTLVKTPYGRRTGVVAALFYKKKIYHVLGAAKQEEELDNYAPLFLETINSFRPISKQDYEDARPLTVKVIKVAEGDTIKSLARSSPLPDHAEDTLRLINGLFPDGEPQAGQLLKIIE